MFRGLRQVAHLCSDQLTSRWMLVRLYMHNKSNTCWATRLAGWAVASCSVCVDGPVWKPCRKGQPTWGQTGCGFSLHLSHPAKLWPGKISTCKTHCGPGVAGKWMLMHCTAFITQLSFGNGSEGSEIPHGFRERSPWVELGVHTGINSCQGALCFYIIFFLMCFLNFLNTSHRSTHIRVSWKEKCKLLFLTSVAWTGTAACALNSPAVSCKWVPGLGVNLPRPLM